MKIGVCGAGGSSAKTKPLTDAGAKLFASPAELVAGCEVIIVMLLNDAATVGLSALARSQQLS
jgi:3-hydroxyisobutyrate dehydrogenase-like beta-hydroxyacid dehydrogenase